MSKHHAVEDEPLASEMSWIQGLAKPATSNVPERLPFYSALVARAPRHAVPAEDSADRVPMVEQTAPIRRISAHQVDTLIGHLDAAAIGNWGHHGTPDTDFVPAPLIPPIEIPADNLAHVESSAAQITADEITTDEITTDATDANAETSTVVVAAPDEIQIHPIPGAEPSSTDDLEDQDDAPVDEAVPDEATADETDQALIEDILVAQAPAEAQDAPAEALSTRVRPPVGRLKKPVLIGAAATLCLLTVGGFTVGGMTSNASSAKDIAVPTPISSASSSTAAKATLATRQGAPAVANRARSIPLAPVAATLRTVKVAVGGQKATSATSSAKTVGALLVERGITLGALDTVSPATTTKLSDGMVVKVDRVALATVSLNIAIPQPAGQTVNDATIVKGTSTVAQRGHAGTEQVDYTVVTVNGKQTAKAESSRRTVLAPVGSVTRVGTKTTFTYVGAEVFTNDTSFGVNWDGLAMCESTHNPKAINANPSAGLPTYGLFQFDIPTWESVGGSGSPLDATPEEQLLRAKLLFQSRGLEPWACRDAAE